MTVRMRECGHCQGEGRAVQWNPGVPLDDDGAPILGPHESADIAGWDVETCRYCNGLTGPDGRTYARQQNGYGHPYKTASSLKAAITRNTARICRDCRGKGKQARLQLITECSQCDGHGSIIDHIDPGDTLPDHVNLTNYVTGHQAWAQNVAVVIRRHPNGALTMAAGLFGLGTVVTVGDYGTALQADDEVALTAKVRGELTRRSHQWCKLVDRETRYMPTAITVDVTRTGYTISTEASRQSGNFASLPPTYTADVLNAPYPHE